VNTCDTGVVDLIRTRAHLAALLILVSPSAPWQGAGAAEPDPLLKAFFDAADPPAVQTAIAAIRAASPGPLEVEWVLRRGRTYRADVKKGWQVFNHTGLDGKSRPYHVYAPKRYDSARKHPVIGSLHGGVNRADLLRPREARPGLHARAGCGGRRSLDRLLRQDRG